MSDSIYAKPDPELRKLFEQPRDPRKLLCGPIDYAKTKHTVLLCNGLGDILKRPFVVDNSPAGLEQLHQQTQATCRHRHIDPADVLFGGEDCPSFAQNFILALRAKGYLVARVNAWEAKRQRQNFQTSSDSLDLRGIAQCLLKQRGSCQEPVAGPYRQLRELMRQRYCLVASCTALANRAHGYVDCLFPGFLNPKASGIEPFSPACWALLADRFSAPQIASRRYRCLQNLLARHDLADPAGAATKLQQLARASLPAQADLIPVWQQLIQSLASQWHAAHAAIAVLDRPIAALLAQTPAAFFTTLPGVGITLAAGVVSETGDPNQHRSFPELCSYAGIIPASKQSGGPDQPPHDLGTRPRCNRRLKNYAVQIGDKLGLIGPPELRQRHKQILDRGGAADFALAKEALALARDPHPPPGRLPAP